MRSRPGPVQLAVGSFEKRTIAQSCCLGDKPAGTHLDYGKNVGKSFSRTHSIATLLCTLVFCFLVQPITSAQSKEVRRALILYEVGPSYPLVDLINEGIKTTLHSSSYRIEFYREYMETVLFSSPADQQLIREFYVHKYQNHMPDVIITVGPSPLRFMIEKHKTSFPGVPVIFCLPNRLAGGFTADSDFTGVEGDTAPAATLEAALRLVPGTKRVVVVGGTSSFDRQQSAAVREQLKQYEKRLDISYLADLAMPELLERLAQLPSHTIILLAALGKDGAGTPFTSSESGPMIVAAANAPVFTLSDRVLNHGEVGGKVASAREQGKIAGAMALQILNGEKPQNIPRVESASVYMFDWRALKRWGLEESNLPADSIVLNRQPTVWETYRWYIVAGLSLIVFEALLIGGLIWQRTSRRKAERELEITFDRLRLAVNSGKSAGWDWDIKSDQNRWFGDLKTIFGISSDTYLAEVGELQRRTHPADRAIVSKAIADARREHKPYAAEFRIVREHDQSTRWIATRGQFYYASNGDAIRMLGMAVDITEQKQMEQQVRESEERFRLVANTAPVMIWMSGPDNLCTYMNPPWLDFRGRSLEAELGRGWVEGVHPEDLEHCLDTYSQAFDEGKSFNMQYRVRRHDGEYRWLLDVGVPRFNSDGSKAGYIGSRLDITERKAAEEASAEMGRRLIQAHEEERAWFARELHDDINQRIAVVSLKLDGWLQDHPRFGMSDGGKLQKVCSQLIEIGKDIQALSHRLHSSKLDYLGLAKAAQSFCREFSEQQNVEIEFTQADIPSGIQKEISVCLFRVLQEALQNAVKHSAARQFKVDLRGTLKEVQLTVSDSGVGFNPQDAQSQRGLGLISMRERLELVNGELSIGSQPGHGTTITARAPLGKTHQLRAAG